MQVSTAIERVGFRPRDPSLLMDERTHRQWAASEPWFMGRAGFSGCASDRHISHRHPEEFGRVADAESFAR
jgi:hypothetical protein